MNKLIMISGIFTVAVTAIIMSCNSSSGKTKDPLPKKTKEEELIQRGSYLVTVGGCDDCHSPKIMGPNGPEIDMERRLSGFPSSRPVPTYNSELIKKGMIQFNEDLTSSAGPWGISFSANLTSDPTGASSWPLENFIYALRHGKLKGLKESRDLLPPMPWFNFAKMTDEDIEAVYTYLKTIKPVQNIVPGPKSPNEVK